MNQIDISSDSAQLRPLAEVDRAMTWAMVESSPDGMLLTDEHGVIMLVNAQIETLFGFDRVELLGCPVETLLPERHRQVHTAHRTRYRAAPRPRVMGGDDRELMGRRRDGTEFPVEVSLSPLTTNDGLRVVATVRDVTERLATESFGHAVLEMIGVAHDGVFMFEPESLQFAYVNHGAAAQLGYTSSELLTMSPLHIKPDLDETSFRELLRPLISGAVDSLTISTNHRRKDGRDVPVEIVLDYPPAVDSRQRRLVVALVRDITDRLASEEDQRRSEARLQVLQDRERLALDMHDLVIQRLFAAGMGLQAVVGSIGDQRTKQRISDTIDELDRTITGLRTAIFGLTNDASTSLTEHLDNVISYASGHLGFAPTVNIEGDIEAIPEDLGWQLVPALTEALSNVARHAQATSVEIAVRVDHETLSMTVLDDGFGIDPDAPRGNGLDNLFDRARHVGGELTIDSTPGQGTTLTLTTPLSNR